MDTGKRNIIILLFVVAVVALTYFAFTYESDKRHNWTELYNHDDKEPYSNKVILELLKGYFPDHKVTVLEEETIAEGVKWDGYNPKNYVFIGRNMYVDSSDLNTLMDFVEQGNNAFFAIGYLHAMLESRLYNHCNEGKDEELYEIEEEVELDTLSYEWDEEEAALDDGDFYYDEEDDEWIVSSKDVGILSKEIEDTTVTMNFNHIDLHRDKSYVFQHVNRNKPFRYEWNYWMPQLDCDSNTLHVNLGYLDTSRVNFIRIPYGNGSFYFHANPIVFTNYHLLDEDALAYAGKVFSHLPEGDIYWDEQSKDYEWDFPNRERSFSETPLKYILSQQSLRWAWYLMLSLVLLYVLFRAKRRQRIIPVKAVNANTSLEFIQTIGRLYHQQENHKNLVGKMMSLFDEFVRRRYGIRLKTANNKLEEDLMKRLVVKSEIPQKQIEDIFIRYTRLNREERVSESHLNSFYLSLEKFYKNCK